MVRWNEKTHGPNPRPGVYETIPSVPFVLEGDDRHGAVIGDAPESLDTLGEIAAAMAAKAANLSDLTDADAARVNLGVGPETHVNGRVLAWSDTLDEYVEIAPTTGVARLAQSTNSTGTATSASASGNLGAQAAIAGTGIVVGDSGGLPVTIRWWAHWQQTVAGDGVAYLDLMEITGTPTLIRTSYSRLPNTIASPMAFFQTPIGEADIGVVTTQRTFELRAKLWAPAASSPTATVRSNAANPTVIRATAGM